MGKMLTMVLSGPASAGHGLDQLFDLSIEGFKPLLHIARAD